MINDNLIEAHHLNLQINQERQQSNVFTIVGHISGIDPTTNRIKVVVPTWTNDNTTYLESGWIPLGTSVAGNQYGIQLLPFGQATVTDVTGENSSQNGNTPMAEQVLVHVVGRKRGLYIQSVQMFNQVDVPPSGYDDPSGVKAAPGEWLFKHSTGQYLYFSNDNNIKLESLTNPAPVVQTDQTPSSCDQNIVISAAAYGQNTNTNNDNVHTATSTIEIISDSKGAITTTDSNLLLSAINPDAESTASNSTSVALNSNVTKGTMGQANIDLSASSKGAAIDNAEFTLESETQSTGTCAGTINVNASDIGAGTLDINVKGLTADLNITVDGVTNVMTVTVTDGIVNLITNIVNVDCNAANVDTDTLDVVCSTTASVVSPVTTVTSEQILLGLTGGTPLLNAVTAAFLNGHTHSGVMAGAGTTGPMTTPIPEDVMCLNVSGS